MTDFVREIEAVAVRIVGDETPPKIAPVTPDVLYSIFKTFQSAFPAINTQPEEILPQSDKRVYASVTVLGSPVPVMQADTASITGVNAGTGITNPTPGQTIASIVLPAGTYNLNWTVGLGGTTGTPEVNNFILQATSGTISPASTGSVNGSGTGSSFPQNPLVVTVAAGGATVAVVCGAATPTAGAVYRASLSASAENFLSANASVYLCDSISNAQPASGNPVGVQLQPGMTYPVMGNTCVYLAAFGSGSAPLVSVQSVYKR